MSKRINPSGNGVRFSVPPNGTWLDFIRRSLTNYGTQVGYSTRLAEMCTGSVMEACEELMGLAAASGISDPFEISLDYRGETLVIDIAYNGHLPLNPHKSEDYEVPDADTQLDELDLDTLWLHMIKQRMDRVHFIVQGSRHILRMVKYRREEGKESQIWVMAIKPALRSDLILSLDDRDKQFPSATLQAKGAGALRLGPSETFLIQRMDGETSFHDLYMEHIGSLGLIAPHTLANLYTSLESMGMLANGEEELQQRTLRRIVNAILQFDISIPNADEVVTATHRITKPLCSPLGIVFLLAIGLSGLVPLVAHRSQMIDTLSELETTALSMPWMVVPIYLLSLIHVALHELGHGVACKHFGGNVPRLGVMFYLATFIFYCDTTAAWNFPRKRDRILVSLGGPIVTFALLGLGFWWAGACADGSSLFWQATSVGFCLSTLFGLVMNFNPLIKMDAYYMLLDYTGITNLRDRSFKFIEQNVLKLFGLEDRETHILGQSERRIFWWYGILGGVMTVAFILLPLYHIDSLLQDQAQSSGRMLLAILLTALMVSRLGQMSYRKLKAVRYREYELK